MRFNKMIIVTVVKFVEGRSDEPQVVQIERPVNKDGLICFDGRWVKPAEQILSPVGTPCEHCGADMVVKYGEDKYRCGKCWKEPTPTIGYYLRIVMPAPSTVRQARINVTASIQLAAMSMIGLGR